MIDWRRRQVILYANPSCTQQLFQGTKLCNAPRDFGDGNNVKASRGDQCGCLRLQTDVTQTDFYNIRLPGPLGGLRNVGQVKNDFSLTPDTNTKDVWFAGEGSSFPDLALVQNGRVEYGVESAAIWAAVVNPNTSVFYRDYDHQAGG
jgi:hypothetical protein